MRSYFLCALGVVMLLVSMADVVASDLANGAVFRSVDDSTLLKIISSDELEFTPEKKSPTWICKYSRNGDSLRIVLTVLGSPQAVYMKIIPEGVEQSDGRKLYDDAHFEAARLAEKQAREERERRQAAAVAALPKPTSTTALPIVP